MKTISRRITAGFAATTLALSLVACSSDDAKDAADKAKDTAGSVAAEASGAADSAMNGSGEESESGSADASGDADASGEAGASDAADASGEADASDSAGSEGETTIKTSAGEVAVPAAFATALEEKASEWGVSLEDIQDIQSTDAGSLATFAKDKLLAYSNETQESVPIIGKIAETFTSEGGLESAVGLPVSPEQPATDGEGWVQEFTKGTISWLKGASGEFGPTVETK